MDEYNRSFERHLSLVDEDCDAHLQAFKRKCLEDFIRKLTKQQDEWEATFREVLNKSQEEIPELKSVTFSERLSIKLIDSAEAPSEVGKPQDENIPPGPAAFFQQPAVKDEKPQHQIQDETKLQPSKPAPKDSGDNLEPLDPFPKELADRFTNNLAIRDFIKIQEQLEQNRQMFMELNTSPALKPFKNELNLFIRTQVNSISNSDQNHINVKTRLLTNLFLGQTVEFQGRQVCAAKHPQGQAFAMDLAAQTFVTVGTKLVNSVPAIAKSMATVIAGIVRNNFPIFKDLVIGHLQQRCPYLVPTYPQMGDFNSAGLNEPEALARMRGMTLIFACIIQQERTSNAWSWLASFLSLKPECAITATVLQAFLQETSKLMAQTYRSQWKKLVSFMQADYVKMIEQVTDQPGGRQPLIKLKNQLSEDYKLC